MKFKFKSKTNKIVINGNDYIGGDLTINGDKIIIDGEVQCQSLVGGVSIILHGGVEKAESGSGDLTINGNVNTASTMSGELLCGNISGNVKTMSGNVHCKEVHGDIETMSGNIYKGE